MIVVRPRRLLSWFMGLHWEARLKEDRIEFVQRVRFTLSFYFTWKSLDVHLENVSNFEVSQEVFAIETFDGAVYTIENPALTDSHAEGEVSATDVWQYFKDAGFETE